MPNLSQAFDRWLFEEYRIPLHGLGLFRILYALILLTLYLPAGLWIPELPSVFLLPPPGITYFFLKMPSAFFIRALNFVLVVAAIGLLFGWQTRAMSFLVTAALLLLRSWIYSIGKINHDILFVILPVFLALAGWGNSYSVDMRGRLPGALPRVRAWPMALFALAISLAMFSAAFAKATSGWLNTSTQAVKGHLLRTTEMNERTNPVSRAALATLPASAWEIADVTTVALEAAFVICMFRRRAFQSVCAIACLFHFGIMLLMEIHFVANIVAYAAFANWWSIECYSPLQWGRERLATWISITNPRTAVVSGFLIGAVYLTWGNPVYHFLF